MKIKQIKQNTEANYQTIHGTGIEPRKPLRVAFSQVAKVNIFCEACYYFLHLLLLEGGFCYLRRRRAGGHQRGR